MTTAAVRATLSGAFALLTALADPLSAAQEPLWEILKLEPVRIDGQLLYIEPAFRVHVESMREPYRQFCEARKENARLADIMRARFDVILDDIDRLLGMPPDEKRREKHKLWFATLLPPGYYTRDVTICVVDHVVVGQYLRLGGTLPGIDYDPVANEATYVMKREQAITYGAAPLHANAPSEHDQAAVIWAVPCKRDSVVEDFAKNLRAFGAIDAMPVLVLYGIVESCILTRLHPREPYFRWFSDGFAQALAIRLARKHFGEGPFRTVLANMQDSTQYADLEKQLNLTYWMGADWTVDLPLESEQRLTSARHVYATLEAQRLIDRHGLDKLAPILEKAAKASTQGAGYLFAPIQEVTGEDMQQRLSRYQSFKTQAEGSAFYKQKVEDAARTNRHAEHLVNLLRYMEIDIPGTKNYVDLAGLLYAMGNEAAGDQVLADHIRSFRGLTYNERVITPLQRGRLELACRSKNPARAIETADELLARDANYLPALTVRMVHLHAKGQSEAALKLANFILDSAKEDTPYAARAREVKAAIEKPAGGRTTPPQTPQTQPLRK